MMAVDKVSEDAVINQLRAAIAADEVRLIQAKAHLQEAHPKVMRLRKAIADANQALDKRMKQLTGELDQSLLAASSSSSEVRKSLLAEMMEAKGQIVVAQRTAECIKDTVKQIDRQLSPASSAASSAELKLAELRRREDQATASLNDAETELDKLRLSESLARAASTVRVLDPPVVFPAGAPQHLERLIIAPVLAAITFLLQLLFEPRVMRVRQALDMLVRRGAPLMKLSPLPLLGLIVQSPSPRVVRTDVLRENETLFERPALKALGRLIVIVSASSFDGKTKTSCTLAAALCALGKRVLLVDAANEHPSLHDRFDVPREPGTGDFEDGIEKPVAFTLSDNLYLTPIGRFRTANDSSLRSAVSTMVSRFDKAVDHVIVDSSAGSWHSLVSPEATLVVVVRLKHTWRRDLAKMVSRLMRCDVEQLYAVINGVSDRDMVAGLLEHDRQPTTGSLERQTAEPALW